MVQWFAAVPERGCSRSTIVGCSRTLRLFEASGRVLVQQARDQCLIRQPLDNRALLDRLQVFAREPNVQPLVLPERALRNAGVAVRSRLATPADFHSPRSAAWRSLFSSASIFI